ncbi:hypothetical protein GCM10027299_02450 [Larkinella ripae]
MVSKCDDEVKKLFRGVKQSESEVSRGSALLPKTPLNSAKYALYTASESELNVNSRIFMGGIR